MSTTVTYKGNTLATVENATKTLKTAGKYMEGDVTLTDVSSSAPTLQAKGNIAPSTSSQTITPDTGYDGLSSVQINAMPTGTAGTPTATKGAVSNHAVSVTPSVTNTTGYITGGTKTGTAVSVSASELVSGTKSITENGTGIDVTNYASVDVNVSGGGGVSIVSVAIDSSYDAIYYTDENMVQQSASAISEVLMPVGTLVFCKGTAGPTPFPQQPHNVALVVSGSGRNGYTLYKVTE